MRALMNNHTNIVMDEFIDWQTPYVLLSTTCDEILSWTIEIQI